IGGDEGVFAARSPDGGLLTQLGMPDAAPRFWIEERGITRLQMGQGGSGSAGRYSLKIPALGGSGLAAGIGESADGAGAVLIGDRVGKIKASMTADGRGMVGVSNASGTAIVALTEGETGGGLLTIGGADGTPMVKMGVKDNRYGIVLAGPHAGFP